MSCTERGIASFWFPVLRLLLQHHMSWSSSLSRTWHLSCCCYKPVFIGKSLKTFTTISEFPQQSQSLADVMCFTSAREVIYSAKARIEDYGLQVNDFLKSPTHVWKERDIAKRGPTSNPVTGGGVCISNVFPLIRWKNSGLREKMDI